MGFVRIVREASVRKLAACVGTNDIFLHSGPDCFLSFGEAQTSSAPHCFQQAYNQFLKLIRTKGTARGNELAAGPFHFYGTIPAIPPHN